MKDEVEDFTNPEDIPLEKGREMIMAGNRERNDGGKTATLMENDTIEMPTIFPQSSLTQIVFLSPVLWERCKLRELYVI